MPNLLLWDIDGTLLTASNVGREAFYAAATEVLGVEVASTEVQFAGKTDPMIAREVLRVTGVAEEDLDRQVRLVMRRFGPQLASRRQQLRDSGKVFPGAREVLAEIDKTRSVATVLTGNIAVNAICKLDAFGLTRHLDLEVGAFGSDDEVRSNLVEIALVRAAKIRNKYFRDEQIWIIGDTPFDLQAARENNIKCLLVATGPFGYDELAALNPDEVAHDLTDISTLLPLLVGD